MSVVQAGKGSERKRASQRWGNPIALAVVLACVFIAAICLVTGFQIDAKSMSVNVLAGLACIAFGIPIAIWIVAI